MSKTIFTEYDINAPILSVISPHEANKEEFELSSMRCGRKLTKDGDVSQTISLLQ